jgi:hypothetical protein
MTTSLVQLQCASLRSKSSYAAYGDFHEEHAELMGATATFWCLKAHEQSRPGRSLRPSLDLPGGSILPEKLRC